MLPESKGPTLKHRENGQVLSRWHLRVGLFVTVSQKKCNKAKGLIADLLDAFALPNNLPELDLKDLEQKTGFLVHLAMAYPAIMTFLQGLYLTMNSWHSMRDGQGWKLSRRAYDVYMSQA